MVNCLVRKRKAITALDAAPVKDKLLWLRHVFSSAFLKHSGKLENTKSYQNQQGKKRNKQTEQLD